jgi:AcrR family transcriptional regulator
MEAATSLIAEKGLGATTADVAKYANVSNGSVFTYFETKADLFNALYFELKVRLTEEILSGMPLENDDVRPQLWHVWSTWTNWGATNPIQRKALAQLSVSDQITAENRQAAAKAAGPIIDLIHRATRTGVLQAASPHYAAALVESVAVTTIDWMIAEKAQAENISKSGFDALCRMLL